MESIPFIPKMESTPLYLKWNPPLYTQNGIHPFIYCPKAYPFYILSLSFTDCPLWQSSPVSILPLSVPISTPDFPYLDLIALFLADLIALFLADLIASFLADLIASFLVRLAILFPAHCFEPMLILCPARRLRSDRCEFRSGLFH